MRKSVPTLLLLLFYHVASIAQTVSNPGNADSLFPVAGKYYQYVSSSEATNYNYINFGIIKTAGCQVRAGLELDSFAEFEVKLRGGAVARTVE